MNKWLIISLGAVLGISHIGMIGLLSNRESKLPSLDIPVGPYTSYEVEAGHDGYRISYRANDPKVMTVQKDINKKGGFLGLGNNKTRVIEQYTVVGKQHVGGGSNEKKISAAQVECIEAIGSGKGTGRMVGASVGAAVAPAVTNIPFVGWVLAGAATMIGMNEGAEIGGNMVEDLNEACQVD